MQRRDAIDSEPQRAFELMEVDRQIALAKVAILNGIDPSMFVAETRLWTGRPETLLAKADRVTRSPPPTKLLARSLAALS